MSKQRLKIWPVRAYMSDDPAQHRKGIMYASISGNSKQRKRAIRTVRREGFNTLHDGGPGRMMLIPK